MKEHVEEFFSEAYDGELSQKDQVIFDRHLGECSVCSDAFAELTIAIDAVRELKPVHMPQMVRIPEMGKHRKWFGNPVFFASWRRRWVAGFAATGMVAMAGLATVVVMTGQFSPKVDIPSTTGGMAVPGIVNPQSLTPSSGCQSQDCFAQAPSATCISQPLSIPENTAVEIPTTYLNSMSSIDGSIEVVIATPTLKVAAGSIVSIYARLIHLDTGIVELPCVALAGPGSTQSQLPAEVSGGQISGIPVIQPATGAELQVSIPSTATTGEYFQIVVEVPSSSLETKLHSVNLSLQIS